MPWAASLRHYRATPHLRGRGTDLPGLILTLVLTLCLASCLLEAYNFRSWPGWTRTPRTPGAPAPRSHEPRSPVALLGHGASGWAGRIRDEWAQIGACGV